MNMIHADYTFPYGTSHEDMVEVAESDGQVFMSALVNSPLHDRIKEFAIMAYGQDIDKVNTNTGYFIQSFTTR